jgi:nitric oxide dioxygenase
MKISAHPLATVRGVDAAIPLDSALISRLRASLAHMMTDPGALARNFYSRLFSNYPELRSMFPDDMTAQMRKLTESLNWIVNTLEKPSEVRQCARELGRRHIDYGARAEHYPLICESLLAGMAATAGDKWDREIAADWKSALELLAGLMQGEGVRKPR